MDKFIYTVEKRQRSILTGHFEATNRIDVYGTYSDAVVAIEDVTAELDSIGNGFIDLLDWQLGNRFSIDKVADFVYYRDENDDDGEQIRFILTKHKIQ